MPVTEEIQDAVKGGGNARSTAIAAAAAAAATGAATFAVRRALSHDGSSGSSRRKEQGREGGSGTSILASAAQSSWEAAADVLIPMAEDAAESAGKYLAQHGPDVVRERIVPRFIEAFNDAS